MEYLRFGNETGETLVILPGLSLKSVLGAADAIRAAYATLAKRYDVYLFDHVREEPKGYRMEDMARDTLLSFDRLHLGRVHLMGVSMGGMVAQAIALTAPERVRSLILCSTAMNSAHADAAVFDGWRTLAEARDARALAEAFGQSVYTPSFFARFRDVIVSSGDGATELDFRNFLISLDAIARFDVSETVRRIACPAFVIGAGEDRVLGTEASRELADALRCPRRIYAGYGHGAYDEAPDYRARIEEFLNALD